MAGRRRGDPHDADADVLRREPSDSRVARAVRAVGTPRALNRVEREHAGDVRGADAVAAGASADVH